MKEIICTNQKELDAAVKDKDKDAQIIIRDTTESLIVEGGTIRSVYGGTIQSVEGGTIQSVYGGTIQYVYGGTIRSVEGGTIQSVEGGTIRSVEGGTIQSVYGGTIQSVYGGTIQYVYGGTIQYVYGGTIRSVYGNAVVQVYSSNVTIHSCFMLAVIIMIGCVCEIKKKSKTVTVIKNKVAEYTKKDFIDIYGTDKDGNMTLYKSVRPETDTDFYTGKIKYEGVVTCPDWDNDSERQCGGGLHLSPLPHLALNYNQGKLLECKVNKKDFVVYKSDITKVRCKLVTVIGEYKQ
jgi:hypothetical protein